MAKFIIERYDGNDNRFFELYVPQNDLQLYGKDKISPSIVADRLSGSKNFSCNGYEQVQQCSTDRACKTDMFLFFLTSDNIYMSAYSVMIEADKIIDKLKQYYNG